MLDVERDLKKVKEREEKQKLKRGSEEERGWATFLLCYKSRSIEEEVKLKEIKS